MYEKKENKNQRLSIDEEIQMVRNKILNWDPNSTGEDLIEIDKKLSIISQNNKLKTRAVNMFFFAALALTIITGVLSFLSLQSDKYKDELEMRLNKQIQSSNKQDSLFNKYLGVDSTGSYTTTRENGKFLSYRDLLNIKYKLEENNRKLRVKSDQSDMKYLNLKDDYDFILRTYDIIVNKKTTGSTTSTTIISKKLDECYGSKTNATKSTTTTVIKRQDTIK